MKRAVWVVAFVVAPVVALAGADPGEAARAATLVPTPGTGHGVLTGAPSSGASKSFAYAPGIGNGCSLPPEDVSAYGAGYSGAEIEVGLFVHLCVGEFPGGTVDVSITPPRGRAIVIPRQAFPRSATRPTITFLVRALPSPPEARLRVTREEVPVAGGPLTGDGSGRYTVVASGGGKRTTETFTLEPAPVPQLIDLGDTGRVDRGGRMRFAATGQRPRSLFRVGIYGPQPANPTGTNAVPLRTAIAARSDERGEALVTLDIAPSSDLGEYHAVLEPYTNTGKLRHPRLVDFVVES